MDEHRTPRGRGRRVWADVRHDVLAEASRLLLHEGLAAVTATRISTETGVSRVTIRRRWRSTAALALDAYVEAVGPDMPIEDTGHLRTDLLRPLEGFAASMADPGTRRAVAQLIGAASDDAAMASAFADHYFGPRRRRLVALLRLARMRGQIRPDADPEVVIDLLWGAAYQRVLLPNLDGTLDRAAVRTMVAAVLDGIAVERGKDIS